MPALFFGVWDIPVSDYVLFYAVVGILGFLLSYLKRFLIIVPITVVLGFAVRDFLDFYRWQVNPPDWYVITVVVSLLLALVASVLGVVLKAHRLKQQYIGS